MPNVNVLFNAVDYLQTNVSFIIVSMITSRPIGLYTPNEKITFYERREHITWRMAARETGTI